MAMHRLLRFLEPGGIRTLEHLLVQYEEVEEGT